MKTTAIFIFSIMFLAGGIVLFHSLNNVKSINSINNTLPTATPTPTPKLTNIQVIKASYGPPFGFSPIRFTVKAGIPVRLEVSATEDGRGCMGSITIPGLNDEIQFFKKNQTNVFEFTPQTPGEYAITCGMGIPHSFIIAEQLIIR